MHFLQIMCVFLHQIDYGCVAHSHSLLSAHLKLGLPQLLLMSASAILRVWTLDASTLQSSCVPSYVFCSKCLQYMKVRSGGQKASPYSENRGNVTWCSRRWSVLWGEIELKKGNICCGKAGEVVITLKRLVRVHLLEMNGRS